jgi:hypothetical protein
MPFRTQNHSRLVIAFVLAGVGATCGAKATTVSYDFTANPASLVTFTEGSGTLVDDLFLTNTATGSNNVPAITLNDGDTIDGTLSLSSPWTMPASGIKNGAGGALIISLQDLDSGVGVDMNESLSFFDHGVEVSPPAGYATIEGSGGAVGIGLLWSGASPAFTFDQIDFSGTMTFARSGIETVSSVSLDSANPYLEVLTNPPSTAPSPGTGWLLLAGLGCLWVMAGGRQAARHRA